MSERSKFEQAKLSKGRYNEKYQSLVIRSPMVGMEVLHDRFTTEIFPQSVNLGAAGGKLNFEMAAQIEEYLFTKERQGAIHTALAEKEESRLMNSAEELKRWDSDQRRKGKNQSGQGKKSLRNVQCFDGSRKGYLPHRQIIL
ncbi:hypothetical protein EPH_0001430 [Eimeria praecox]|uniref:Uncharacterized protein n=1 Tax=Eimeria praecox TaxID=51316 RepID=U6G663_9EIME|nr:hypothetical protein EPH_0001430 [Eimeria praecox]